ncbi:hypothetical protein [Nonomuraea endophytica]|uniref:hypothetical protein n=1 Tax=Nonomuraea endophytica TaxID=714136 RepID=UPI0037C77F9A
MTEPLLDLVRRTPDAARLLAWPFGFDVARTEHVEAVRLASGDALEAVAGDGSGGTYFLCGDPGGPRPVLYADSEGGAALVAADLSAALELVVRLPYWVDCLGLGGVAEMAAAVPGLESEYGADDLDGGRAAVSGMLALAVPPVGEVLSRLLEATGRPGYVLLNDEDGAYERLG